MKNQVKKILNQEGFGIIEVVLLVGMLTGMTYFLLSQQQARIKDKHRSEFDHDMNNVVSLINQVLSDPHHCTVTVLGQPVVGTILNSGPVPAPGIALKGQAVGGDLTSIRLGTANILWPRGNFSDMSGWTGGVALTAGQEIYPGFEVGDINLINDRVNDFIRIQFRYTAKKKGLTKTTRILNKDFILSTKKTFLTVKECRLQTPEEILFQGCNKLGTWDSNLKFCNIPNYYLKSRDLYPLYEDGQGGLVNLSPVPAPRLSVCTCPTSQCQNSGYNCCTPATCVGEYTANGIKKTFLTEDPPISSLSGGVCTFTSRCLARPDAGILK